MRVKPFMHKSIQIDTHSLFDQALSDLSERYPSLQLDILNSFYTYVSSETADLPETFGRDSIFNEPYLAQRAKLRHLHICLPPSTFDVNRCQQDRKNPLGDPENDVFLVYVRHEFYEHRFLIVALLQPDAHALARDTEVMKQLGYIAQEFQDS